MLTTGLLVGTAQGQVATSETPTEVPTSPETPTKVPTEEPAPTEPPAEGTGDYLARLFPHDYIDSNGCTFHYGWFDRFISATCP